MFKACVLKQSCQVPGGSQTKLFVLRLREICVAILTHVSVSFLIMFAPVQILGQHPVSQGLGQCPPSSTSNVSFAVQILDKNAFFSSLSTSSLCWNSWLTTLGYYKMLVKVVGQDGGRTWVARGHSFKTDGYVWKSGQLCEQQDSYCSYITSMIIVHMKLKYLGYIISAIARVANND